MKHYIITGLLFLVFAACCKNEEDCDMSTEEAMEEPMIDEDTIQVLWKSVLVSDTTEAIVWKTLAFNENYVYSSYEEFDNGGINPNVYKFDAQNGSYLGPWDGFIYNDNKSYSSNRMFGQKDYLIIESSESVYVVDYETDEIIHSENFDRTDRLSADKGLVFASNTADREMFSELLYKDLNDLGPWRSLFRKENEDGYEDAFFLASADYNEVGDTIVYMIQSGYNFIIGDERSSLRAYNLSRKEEVWHAHDIEPSGVASKQSTPVIDGDRLYFCGGSGIHCLNRHTGEYVWMREFDKPEFFGNSNYPIVGEMMYFQSSLGIQYFLDKHNGNILYKKDYTGAASNLAYGNGYIIFGSSEIVVIDDQTGDERYIFETDHPGGSFNGHVSYDAANNRLYADDGYFLYALEIPDK